MPERESTATKYRTCTYSSQLFIRAVSNSDESFLTALTLVKTYLVAYNFVSAIGWAYILILTLIHVFNLDGRASIVPAPAGRTAASILTDLFFTSSSKVESRLPLFLKPIYQRSMTTYSRVGPQTAFVQTFAILEVVHVLLGWVKSPLATTGMQVSSRLFLIWAVTEQFPNVRFLFVLRDMLTHMKASLRFGRIRFTQAWFLPGLSQKSSDTRSISSIC